MAYIYTVWFSYFVKKMVTSPTSNFFKLSLLAHAVTITTTVVAMLAIGFTTGFGLSVII